MSVRMIKLCGGPLDGQEVPIPEQVLDGMNILTAINVDTGKGEDYELRVEDGKGVYMRPGTPCPCSRCQARRAAAATGGQPLPS